MKKFSEGRTVQGLKIQKSFEIYKSNEHTMSTYALLIDGIKNIYQPLNYKLKQLVINNQSFDPIPYVIEKICLVVFLYVYGSSVHFGKRR